jgi:hypothetical protein
VDYAVHLDRTNIWKVVKMSDIEEFKVQLHRDVLGSLVKPRPRGSVSPEEVIYAATLLAILEQAPETFNDQIVNRLEDIIKNRPAT